MSDPQWPHALQPSRLLGPWDFPSKSTGVGSHSLLQGIFRTRGSNPGRPHCRQILYHLSHQGSPKTLTLINSVLGYRGQILLHHPIQLNRSFKYYIYMFSNLQADSLNKIWYQCFLQKRYKPTEIYILLFFYKGKLWKDGGRWSYSFQFFFCFVLFCFESHGMFSKIGRNLSIKSWQINEVLWGQTNVGKTDLWLVKKFELRLIDRLWLYCSIFSCCFSFFKAKQRAEVLQSTQRFFSEQQQNKQIGGKAQKVDSDSSKPPETLTDPPGVYQEKVEEKPPPAPTIATKPIRTGPIKPQAIKTEETKS